MDFSLNICDVVTTLESLFEQMKLKVTDTIDNLFGESLAISINIDKITEPLIERCVKRFVTCNPQVHLVMTICLCSHYILLPITQLSPPKCPTHTRVDGALTNFTASMLTSLNAVDCSRRFLQESQPTSSLVTKISDAISSVNTALASAGIRFDAKPAPYFKSATLSAGVSVELSATIQMTAAQVLELVTDVLQNTTSPEEEDANFSKLGVGTSSDSSSPVSIDLDQLLSDTVLSAGFDLTFGIELNLNEIQSIITAGTAIDEALNRGIALEIDTWGAFASLIVDPIELDITLFGQTIAVRDSHLAMSVELRSKGKFFASVESLVNGTADSSVLIPDLTVPISSAIVFDVNVYDGVVISPILRLDSTNLIDADFVLDFDVDLSAFLDTDVLGSFTLDKIIQNATELLDSIASLGPELNAGGATPSPLDGMFNIVNELQDLGDTLGKYVDLVSQGTPDLVCFHAVSSRGVGFDLTLFASTVQDLITPEIRPVIKHASRLMHYSALMRKECTDSSKSFTNYTFERLRNASLLSEDIAVEEFSACDYLPRLQKLLFDLEVTNENVTYENFIILPENLTAQLQEFYNDTNTTFNGEFVSIAI